MSVVTPPRPRRVEAPTELGWRFFGWIGLALVVVGLADVALAGYPYRPGDPDWEFAFIHQTASILPVPALGMAALLGSAQAQGSRRMVRSVVVGAFLLVVILLGLSALFLSVAPLALSETPAALLPGVQKAVARTLVAFIVFSVAFLFVGIAAWRHSRSVAPRV